MSDQGTSLRSAWSDRSGGDPMTGPDGRRAAARESRRRAAPPRSEARLAPRCRGSCLRAWRCLRRRRRPCVGRRAPRASRPSQSREASKPRPSSSRRTAPAPSHSPSCRTARCSSTASGASETRSARKLHPRNASPRARRRPGRRAGSAPRPAGVGRRGFCRRASSSRLCGDAGSRRRSRFLRSRALEVREPAVDGCREGVGIAGEIVAEPVARVRERIARAVVQEPRVAATLRDPFAHGSDHLSPGCDDPARRAPTRTRPPRGGPGARARRRARRRRRRGRCRGRGTPTRVR